MEVTFDDRCEDRAAPVHRVLEVGDLGDELPGVTLGAGRSEPDHLVVGILVFRLMGVAQRGLPLPAHGEVSRWRVSWFSLLTNASEIATMSSSSANGEPSIRSASVFNAFTLTSPTTWASE